MLILPFFERVEICRVGHERTIDELVDRGLQRARVLLVGHEGVGGSGRVEGGEAEGPVDDLPERIGGVGAEVARLGLPSRTRTPRRRPSRTPDVFQRTGGREMEPLPTRTWRSSSPPSPELRRPR